MISESLEDVINHAFSNRGTQLLQYLADAEDIRSLEDLKQYNKLTFESLIKKLKAKIENGGDIPVLVPNSKFFCHFLMTQLLMLNHTVELLRSFVGLPF